MKASIIGLAVGAFVLLAFLLGSEHRVLSSFIRFDTVKLTSGKASTVHEERNLVVFVALGSTSAITTIHYNVFSHFLEWDCIVYTYKTEDQISSDDPMVKEIMSKCSLVRLPGLFWEHFLMTLTPELVQQYEHIAVVLDDVFAPTQGDTPVNVTKLLQGMKKHNMSSISPSVQYCTWPSTKPRPRDDRCIWHVEQIETFFQIFTRELFMCWHSFMHYSNIQGWCLDLCLDTKMCPSISRLAVDASMISYHIGYKNEVEKWVPESARVGINLTSSRGRGGTPGSLVLCQTLGGCPRGFFNSTKVECDAKL